jgi:CRP/FNR family transcriptional regulator, cyclic AMP receptor protein
MDKGTKVKELVTPELLQKAYIFQDVDESVLEGICGLAEILSFKKGASILEKGVANDSIWFLAEGECIIREVLEGGLPVDLFTLKAADVFGEISYTDREPASATVVAHGDVKVVRIGFDDLDTWFIGNCQAQCMFLRRINSTFSFRLRRANMELRKTFEGAIKFQQAKLRTE